MAAGDKSAVPAALVPKIWAAKVWTEAKKASFFDKFCSTDGSNIVHVNKDLTKAKGDKVNFGLQMNLAGAGVTGNTTLAGAEDVLTTYDFGVTVAQVRNAVVRYDADDQKSPYAELPRIKAALVQWYSDYQDNKLITVLSASATAGEFTSTASAGTEVAIVDADKLTCAAISFAKRKAIKHAPKVKPLKIDGKEKFVMLISPEAARDLKTDTVWLAAQQNANVRGSANPIFSGALGEYDGVILYEYERVSITATGASSAKVSHNLLLGQQAACYAVAREMYPIEHTDDYGNVKGNGVAAIVGIAKSIYNSHDYGVIQVMSAAKAD